MHELPSCDLCADPGTNQVVDVEEIDPEDGFTRWTVHSRHTFCDRHARPPIRYPHRIGNAR